MSHKKKDFNPAFPVDYNPVVIKPAAIDQPVKLDPELLETPQASSDSPPEGLATESLAPESLALESLDFNPAFPVRGQSTSTKQASIHQDVEPMIDLADDGPGHSEDD
ncbi:MAG: hypothetical protein AAF560_29950 [Acidobacteriota bacterium]